MTEGLGKRVSTKQNWETCLVYRRVHNTRYMAQERSLISALQNKPHYPRPKYMPFRFLQ